MTPSELVSYLHTQIPLSRAMEVGVASLSPDVVELVAPLAPNYNHQQTAFGGSISTIATLACWSLVNLKMSREKIAASLVIQRHSVEYILPVYAEFTAVNLPVPSEAWDRFFDQCRHHGKGRVKVLAEVRSEGRVCAAFEGQFVALRDARQD